MKHFNIYGRKDLRQVGDFVLGYMPIMEDSLPIQIETRETKEVRDHWCAIFCKGGISNDYSHGQYRKGENESASVV